MTEKKQCTNPFIILFCQRLVRAGWSQHVCGAPSCPPPPGEGPGEQLGAVAEKAWGEQSTVWQGLGGARLRLFPHIPLLGCKQRILGCTQDACPGIPSQAQGTCVSSIGLGAAGLSWSGSPQPCAGFIAGGRARALAAQWGALGSALQVAPGTRELGGVGV